MRGLASPSTSDEQLLIDYFSGHVRALTHPVYLYHWTNNTELAKERHPQSPRASTYATQMAEWYWKSAGSREPDEQSSLGEGFYFAVDPGASANFGGKKGSVIQIELQTGTRLLEVNAPVPEPIQEALARSGCTQTSAGLHEYFRFHAGQTDCARNLQRIVTQELHVWGLKDRFWSHLELDGSLCKDPEDRDWEIDVILISPDGLTGASPKVFNSNARRGCRS